MKHVPREIYREEELQMCGRITGTFEFGDIRVRANLDRAIYRCTRPALTSPTLSNTCGKPPLHHPHGRILRVADGTPVESFTIITTEPNELVRPIHNRMPVILRPEDEEQWLDASRTAFAKARSLLKPLPADLMNAEDIAQSSTQRNMMAYHFCLYPLAFMQFAEHLL